MSRPDGVCPVAQTIEERRLGGESFRITGRSLGRGSSSAGARYTAEKKTPARIIEFVFDEETLYVTAADPAWTALTILAA